MHADEAFTAVQIFRMLGDPAADLPWHEGCMHEYDEFMTGGFRKTFRMTLTSDSADRIDAHTFRERLLDHYRVPRSLSSGEPHVPEEIHEFAEDGTVAAVAQIADSARADAAQRQVATYPAPVEAANTNTGTDELNQTNLLHALGAAHRELSSGSSHAVPLASVPEEEPTSQTSASSAAPAELQTVSETSESNTHYTATRSISEGLPLSWANPHIMKHNAQVFMAAARQAQRVRCSPVPTPEGTHNEPQAPARQLHLVDRTQLLQETVPHQPIRPTTSMYIADPVLAEVAAPPICHNTPPIPEESLRPCDVKVDLLMQAPGSSNWVFTPESPVGVPGVSSSRPHRRAVKLNRRPPTRMADRVGDLEWGFEGRPPPYSGVQETDSE